MTKIIDGKSIAARLKDELKEKVGALKSRGITPKLGIVMAGDDEASEVYKNSKVRACEYVGIETVTYKLPADTTTDKIADLVRTLSDDPEIHGIFIEHPLPSGIDRAEVLAALDPSKDVDGIHPVNIGALCSGEEGFVPCTPAAVMRLLRESDISIKGKNAVVVGASNIVGKPMGLLLLEGRGCVTICRSATPDLKGICSRADILIAAVGSPRMIGADYIKPGAVVMDVGINTLPDSEGGGICGDVDYEAAAPLCSAITPVPGGVGPMTVVMMMENVYKSAEQSGNLLLTPLS